MLIFLLFFLFVLKRVKRKEKSSSFCYFYLFVRIFFLLFFFFDIFFKSNSIWTSPVRREVISQLCNLLRQLTNRPFWHTYKQWRWNTRIIQWSWTSKRSNRFIACQCVLSVLPTNYRRTMKSVFVRWTNSNRKNPVDGLFVGFIGNEKVRDSVREKYPY